MAPELWTAETGFEEAKRRIAVCNETGATTLDLNDLGLEAIPKEISELTALTELDLSGNWIDQKLVETLSNLTSLTVLNLSKNNIGGKGMVAISKLCNLTQLNLGYNRVGDQGAVTISNLSNLTQLNLDNNRIGHLGAKALSKLAALTGLNLDYNRIGDRGAEAISKLSALTQLNLGHNNIGERGAKSISKLSALKRLNLDYNPIGDIGAKAISKLSELVQLDVDHTGIGDSGAETISKLSELNQLYFRRNNIGDNGAEAIVGLPKLQDLYLDIGDEASEIPEEVLSDGVFDNCLPRLRAHFDALKHGSTSLDDVKLMILGNGQIGKTQLARRLCGEDFDETVETTHGIQIRKAQLFKGYGDKIHLKIWDFGGQDIYLGTHARLLRTRAVFLAVWAQNPERRSTHIVREKTSRNFQLDYWVRYIGDMAGYESPLLVVQTQCDTDRDYAVVPLSYSLAQTFRPTPRPLEFSAKTGHGLDHLERRILEAAQHLHDKRPKIGTGWAAVKAEMEANPEQGIRRISLSDFKAVCRAKAGIDDVATTMILLDFLHELGTLFYDEALFDDWIILDQQWALDAIYTLFDRSEKGVYKQLTELRLGRFKPSHLAVLAWDAQGHDKDDQYLFLQMMQSCDLCFEYRPAVPDKGVEAVYIAPQLLPEEPSLADSLVSQWEDSQPIDWASYQYRQHIPGLFHRLMAKLGGLAGVSADYWKNGLQLFDKTTQSFARVTQDEDEFTIRIEARGRDEIGLLSRLSEFLEAEQKRIGVVGTRTQLPSKIRNKNTEDDIFDKPENNRSDRSRSPVEQSLRPGVKDAEKDQIYVSYAWANAGAGKDARAHASSVEQICDAAKANGTIIKRDTDRIKPGGQISKYMSDLAAGSKIVIVLTPGYLKSYYCMFELHEIWRECRREDKAFLQRIEVFNLAGEVSLEALNRMVIQDYWVDRHAALKAAIEKRGWDKVAAATRAEAIYLEEFASRTDEILAVINDTVQWRNIDEIEELVLQL